MLNSRIDPVRQKMSNPTWKELIARCQTDGVDLSAKTMYGINMFTKVYYIRAIPRQIVMQSVQQMAMGMHDKKSVENDFCTRL